MRMYKNRLKGYEAIGYTIQKEDRDSNQQPNQYEYVQSEDLLDTVLLFQFASSHYELGRERFGLRNTVKPCVNFFL